MSTDPPTSDAERSRHWITDVEVSPDNNDPNCKFSAKVFIDDELVCSLPWIDYTRPLRWSGLLLCKLSPLSKLALRLCKSVNGKPRYFNFPAILVSEADGESGELIQELPEAVWVFTIKSLTHTLAEHFLADKIANLDGVEFFRGHPGLGEPIPMRYLFKSAIQFARLVAEALPESTAKISLLICMKTWEHLDKQLDHSTPSICNFLTGIRDIADITSQASSSMLAIAMSHSKDPIQDILTLLEDVSVYIFNRCATNDLVQTPSDEVEPDEELCIETYLARLEDLQKVFYESWSAATASCTATGDVVDDNPSITPPQDIETNLDESTKMTDLHVIVNLLKPVDPSGYDPDRACLDGTREGILTKIVTWTQNRESSESFMWISGQPGTGKTSIAASLCQRLDKIQALAGSFFCQRGDPHLNNPLRLLNTIVCDIATTCPVYAHEVAKAIQMNPRLYRSHFSLRFESLIAKPLERLKFLTMPMTLALIVDGLDECGDCDSREKVFQTLYKMSGLVPWLKVIVTARPMGEIQEYFQTNCSHGTIVQIQTYDAYPDIRAYIEGQLGHLARVERWSQDSIDKLCEMAEGVFLWAVLAVKYIKKSPLPALPRLLRILDKHQSQVSNHFDKLYTQVLNTILDDNDEETKDAYFRCIGLVLSISERGPIDISDLEGLLLVAGRVEQPTFERIVRNLAPLLMKDGRNANFHHPYFRDYITDPSRSGQFVIQLDLYKAKSAELCLEIMQRDLEFNICKLESSHLRNHEVPDLKLRIKSHIGPALQYACTHWIGHFTASPNQTLLTSTENFFDGPQLMYWLEVLSILDRLDVAISGLSNLIALDLTQYDGWYLLASWARDAHRFLLSFYDAIAASAPHLYISALAFAPSKSLTAQRMRLYFPNTIKVAAGDKNWYPCVKSILHPHQIQSLSTSPDGLRLIAGYSDGSLCLWDSQTGVRMGELLIGHREPVTCAVFSPDGNLVASSSCDTTIRVWEAKDALKTHGTLPGHSSSVNCVAFSPNTAILASGSSDKTIRLWDPKALCSIGEPYVGHTSRVSSLAFSPDGTKLASASWDKTIRIWSVDLTNSKLSGNSLLITGHSDSVTCIAFSPNSSKIASGSVDRTIRIWDTQTGVQVETRASLMKHFDSISAIAFSSDGKLIASSSLDGVIQLWSSQTLTALCSFGHFNPVTSITFVPGTTCLFSGSTDMTIRVWDITTTITEFSKPMITGPITGHSSIVRSVAISNDGALIISGSHDKTIRMWDAQTGSLIGQPLTEHSHYVIYLEISPDGTQFVSSSDDKTVKLWDMTTRRVIYSHQHNDIVRCVKFSPKNDQIAFASHDSKIYTWKPPGRVEELGGHTSLALTVAFSPDGTCLASAALDKLIVLWDLTTRNRLREPLSGHRGDINSIQFSPCGMHLLSGSKDQTVRLWDVKSGGTIRVLSGHSTPIRTVSFSADGAHIASGSEDGTVRIWGTETGRMIGQPLSGHSDYVWSVKFSRDGNYVISASADSTIRVWSLVPSHLVPEQTNDRPRALIWPENPYGLSCHPPHSGWVTDDQQGLNFWLPAHYEQPNHFLSHPAHVPQQRPRFDYSRFVHGTAWVEVVSNLSRGCTIV